MALTEPFLCCRCFVGPTVSGILTDHIGFAWCVTVSRTPEWGFRKVVVVVSSSGGTVASISPPKNQQQSKTNH